MRRDFNAARLRFERALEADASNDLDVKAQLMTTLSQVYLGLGSYRTGDQIIRQSMALPITEPAVRARQFIALGGSQIRQSEYAAAIRNFDKAIALSRTRLS